MAAMKRPVGVYPKQKVPGPEGFASLPKAEKPSAAAEWVNNTSSGNATDDAAYYAILLKQNGIVVKNNPFKKMRRTRRGD